VRKLKTCRTMTAAKQRSTAAWDGASTSLPGGAGRREPRTLLQRFGVWSLLIAAVACGGGGNGVATPDVTVSVTPALPTVFVAGRVQFAATVENATDLSVTWSATGGHIDAAGVLTAPDVPGQVEVTATSKADPTRSASASVSVIALAIGETADRDQLINIAECQGTTADDLSFGWGFPAFVAGGTYVLTASDTQGCPPATTTRVVRNVTLGTVVASGATGSFPPAGSAGIGVSGLLANLGFNCVSPVTAIFFCVTLTSAPNAPPAEGLLALDLLSPAAPSITSVAPADAALVVAWTPGTASPGPAGAQAGFKLTVTAAGDPTNTHTTTLLTPGSLTSFRIAGLTNRVLYDVTVQAFSPGGNPSAPSAAVRAVPGAI
jgi:hypothetical protein